MANGTIHDPNWFNGAHPDPANMINWHWTEKNATAWSKARLHELLGNFQITHYDMECCVESVDQCNGEATANNRKGKLIFFYEWQFKLKWQGRLLKNSGMYHKGTILIRNFAKGKKINDVNIIITVDETNDESEKLKRFMFNVGRNRIRQLLNTYINDLKTEYTKILLLNKKNAVTFTATSTSTSTFTFTSTSTTTTTTTATATTVMANVTALLTPRASTASIPSSIPQCLVNDHTINANVMNTDLADGKNDNDMAVCKVDARQFQMSEQFQCNAHDLYATLTTLDLIQTFTNSSAKCDAIKDGEFYLYDDFIHGKFLELIPDKKLTFTWRLKSWPLDHYSTVTIDLNEFSDYTQLYMKQYDIPATEYDTMKTNWYRYYWDNIRRTFGYNSTLTEIS